MALDTFLIILCRARGGWRSHCRRIALTIVDTPGFGDNIDNEFAFQEILGYLEREYDHVLVEESRIKRNPRFRDNRVHALLYFIPPTGHVLREIDIELMRRISLRVNLIPVGKADSLTPTELKVFKKRIMEDIEHYDIPVYNFPYEDEEDDEETIADNSELFATTTSSILMARSSADLPGAHIRDFVAKQCWISATNHPNYMVGDIIGPSHQIVAFQILTRELNKDVKLSMREYLDSQRGY
ncbi:Septin-domain-containing protein [Auriculariales sp. MPI-PUGE-AT-0066]|nr:Septin-domain-containing protein [Auriculariales sp. MPI-PUGE-AT-0066]